MKKQIVPEVGLVFGKFYPLHCGHIYMIEKAYSEVDELHIMLGYETSRDERLFRESNLPRKPTVSDRLSWLKKTFVAFPNIFFHKLNEEGIVGYPDGWADWSDRVKHYLPQRPIKPTRLFTSELQDKPLHERYFGWPVKVIDEKRNFFNISATKIRQHPYKYWDYIAKAAQPFFVKRICITDKPGAVSFGLQFANLFNTRYVTHQLLTTTGLANARSMTRDGFLEMIQDYVLELNEASDHANRCLFTNLNFTLLQDSFEKMFGQKQPQIDKFEATYLFDLIIDPCSTQQVANNAELFTELFSKIKSLGL